jgi:hypothetical protein
MVVGFGKLTVIADALVLAAQIREVDHGEELLAAGHRAERAAACWRQL